VSKIAIPIFYQVGSKLVKVKLIIKHYAMKAYGGVDVQIHIFSMSSLAGVGNDSSVLPLGKGPPVPIG
jgi:hypothetical protein